MKKKLKISLGEIATYLRDFSGFRNVKRDTASDEAGYACFKATRESDGVSYLLRAQREAEEDGYINIEEKDDNGWEWIDAINVNPA